MTADLLGQARLARCGAHRPLHGRFVKVKPRGRAPARIAADLRIRRRGGLAGAVLHHEVPRGVRGAYPDRKMRREYRSVTTGGDAGNDLTRLTWISLRGFFGLLSGASAGLRIVADDRKLQRPVGPDDTAHRQAPIPVAVWHAAVEATPSLVKEWPSLFPLRRQGHQGEFSHPADPQTATFAGPR